MSVKNVIFVVLSWIVAALSNSTTDSPSTSRPALPIVLPLKSGTGGEQSPNHNTLENDDVGAPSGDFTHMFFATSNNTVITSQIGSTAFLPCAVHNLGEGVVSWIRRKDRHLITVGVTTYNADQRYQIIHTEKSEDWTLQIKYVQKRDAGLYECQVASHPPTSIFIQLNVVEAKAQISGPAEKYLKPGSTLRLQCVVLKATETPAYIFWYHNSRMVNFDIELGVNVSTNLMSRTSSLTIPVTNVMHAGNYTCTPNNAQPASIYVHIFNGENPAAMQSGCNLKRSPSILFAILVVQILRYTFKTSWS